MRAPGIRLRAEAKLAGDHGRPQIAFGQVILGGHLTIVRPVIETLSVGAEDLLDAPNAQMWHWFLHGCHERRLERRRLLVALRVRERLGAQPHRGASCGAAVLTKAVTSAASGNSLSRFWTSCSRWL